MTRVWDAHAHILCMLLTLDKKNKKKEGYQSLPIPASQVLDRENWYAAISHKAVARMAGLGGKGKICFLLHLNLAQESVSELFSQKRRYSLIRL